MIKFQNSSIKIVLNGFVIYCGMACDRYNKNNQLIRVVSKPDAITVFVFVGQIKVYGSDQILILCNSDFSAPWTVAS